MNKIELLSPVGDWDCLLAAVQNGADSVYFGSTLFNARASANNFDVPTLKKAIQYCKLRNVRTFLTLNILIKNSEFNDAINLAQKAYEFGVDALIVQDLGLARYLIKNFPDMPIHGSTQMSIHNLEGVLELQDLGFKRVVLARELPLNEIQYICKNSKIEIETFIHGALCISYSGQCLFSSIIGGRSGNRGKCAGPCRLPYELLNHNNVSNKETTMDKGYLLSPKDLCTLDYLPQLIDAGVKCFKIEGRLKSPEYVATVTRIYRKYIDKILNKEDYIVEDSDMKQLLQIFNRGGFSSGHLSDSPNKNLIFKERPNNIGLFLGNISKFSSNKGHITLTLNEDLAIGDTIYTEKEDSKYTVSELMQKTLNLTHAKAGTRVTIGRMKGNISVGDKVYKLNSKELLNTARLSYTNCENKKININANVIVKKRIPISISVNYNNSVISVSSDVVPIPAINSPITSERIIKQICKTSNTPFNFKTVNVQLDDGLFIPNISVLNELRRNLLLKLQEHILAESARTSNFELNNITLPYDILKSEKNNNKKISILLRNINSDIDYSILDFKNISSLYIPLKCFVNKKLEKTLEFLSDKVNTYVYLPSVIKNNYKNIIKKYLEDIIQKYKIKGFVISNLSNLKFLEGYKSNFEIIGNSSLNIFNNYSIKECAEYGINKVTLSRELSKTELEDILKYNLDIDTELIVYGTLPIMSCNYCFLGKSNMCYPECKRLCSDDNSYYLKDRLGFKFRIVSDNIQSITSIFNSKILSISPKTFNVSSVRIDILDENVTTINKIIETVKSGKSFEGKEYTSGRLEEEK